MKKGHNVIRARVDTSTVSTTQVRSDRQSTDCAGAVSMRKETFSRKVLRGGDNTSRILYILQIFTILSLRRAI